MSKNNYTFEQHQILGEELFHMRERLLYISSDLSRAYGKNLSKIATEAYSVIDELRNQLDSLVFKENPERETNELANTYYCANRLRTEQPAPQT